MEWVNCRACLQGRRLIFYGRPLHDEDGLHGLGLGVVAGNPVLVGKVLVPPLLAVQDLDVVQKRRAEKINKIN